MLLQIILNGMVCIMVASMGTKFKVGQAVRVAQFLDEPPCEIYIGDIGTIKAVKGKMRWGFDNYIETYFVQVGSCCDDFREDELAALVTSININEII